MIDQSEIQSRRQFLATSALTGGGCALAGAMSPTGAAIGYEPPANRANKALVAITLDLEMSRNFPVWEDTHWDYEKGNLNAQTKDYAVEACRRIKDRGGIAHLFAVGRVFEQENVDWLKQIAQAGHSIGNHTYDHVNVTATKPEQIQFRFQRAPWLIEGRSPAEVIRENIRLTSVAMKSRLGIEPVGFRTPGGFTEGLTGREDLQKMLLSLGFTWVSSRYPAHPLSQPGEAVTPAIFDGIVEAQQKAQPFVYPTSLVEVPMNPISDIGAFRGGRWKLDDFLTAIRRGVQWAIEQRACYDFLCHPSCLYVTDPKFQAIELICDLVKQAGDGAELVNLTSMAGRPKS